MAPAVIEAVSRAHETMARAMPPAAGAGTNDINGNGHAGLAASVRDLAARMKNVE
jgi:hypothetical protein